MERRKVSKNKNGGWFRRFVFGDMTPHEAYRYFINIIFPNICPCCEEIIDYDEDFCESCTDKIVRCSDERHIEYADEFVAYCYYEKGARAAILKFKKDACGNSYYAFASAIVKALQEKQLLSQIDVVVYLPMSKKEEKSRGYNLVKLIAKEIHYMLEIPCVNALYKTRTTFKQKELNGRDRKTNLIGAYKVFDNVELNGKCVLVVDDLCTTGSTLSEAARALKDGGAEKVIAATFSKTKNIES